MELTLDTLKLYDELKLTFSEEQAHKLSDVLKRVEQTKSDAMATKADIYAVRSELKLDIADVRAEIQEVKAELKSDIATLRAEMRLYFVVLLCVIIITNPKAIELISKVLGILK